MEKQIFIQAVGEAARKDMEKSGVLASLTIAQAILESGWGTSELAQNANALFGIKADGRWSGKTYSKETQECYDGVNYTTVTALFRAYSSWDESITDHSAFLLTGNRYAAVIGEKDYKTACYAIKAAGYATAPDYAEKLISLIESYGLTAYDGDMQKEETIMSNSSLVTYTNISSHKNSPRNHAIDTITIHCIVGQWTAKQGCDYFATTDRECSANYVVGKDGSIGLSVDEKDRSWCSSNAANDNRAITIEVASDTKEPYAVTGAAYNALLNLVTDICKRNGIKKLVWSTNKSDRVNHRNGCNMTVHRDFANKSCPGTYLYERHGEIAAEVNKRLSAGTGTENPAGGSAMYYVQAGAFSKKENAEAHAKALREAGFDTMLKTFGGLYKVQTGAYSVKANADAQVKALKAAGFDAFVTTDGGSAAPTPSYIEYTVKKGDSLWAIAEKLLGDGSRYTEIKALSGLTSDTIYAGNVLKVPAK